MDDKIKFVCNEGFYSDSEDMEAQCLPSGEWTVRPPKCKRISCGVPPAFKGAVSSDEDSYLYGSVVTYTCAVGYQPRVSTVLERGNPYGIRVSDIANIHNVNIFE